MHLSFHGLVAISEIPSLLELFPISDLKTYSETIICYSIVYSNFAAASEKKTYDSKSRFITYKKLH